MKNRINTVLYIVSFGAAWGLFECTIGYLLHMLPLNIGWLVWYPVACFFMLCVYRKTDKAYAVFLVGCLCASIKLLNLFSTIRVDKVINPAVSIVLEALAMSLMIAFMKVLSKINRKNIFFKATAVVAINTLWRLFYIGYLLFLVPDWIRDYSVIRNAASFIEFILKHNLITSTIIFTGYLCLKYIFIPIDYIEQKFAVLGRKLSLNNLAAKSTFCLILLICNMFVEIVI